MPTTRTVNQLITVNAYRGDAKTLLAFDLVTGAAHDRLAGFTVEVHTPGLPPYYVDNNLRLAASAIHAQISSESPFASVNAPIQKFRWVHVPGLVHQGGTPTFGTYAYVVTPRYFSDRAALLPLDPSMGVAIDVEVGPFAAGPLKLGFTRGYVQSQAFVRHFGSAIDIRPTSDDLLYDTTAIAGANVHGDTFTYAQEYEWLGFTARRRIFELLDEVRDDSALFLDVFAHDLDEPDVCSTLLELGAAGRVRIVLDDAGVDYAAGEPSPEDRFAAVFAARAGTGALKRGVFGRHAHDKVLVVSDENGPRTVLTGSANFSVTGLYVNADHVLVFDDRDLAAGYASAFGQAWECAARDPVSESHCSTSPFSASRRASGPAGMANGPANVALHTPVRPSRALPSAEPGAAPLPVPFSRVPRRAGDEGHHEFVVCGFGGSDPVVFCGSSNLALGGQRGDDGAPLAIRGADVATAFAIEALILECYERFVDRLSQRTGAAPAQLAVHPDKRMAAVTAGWFLDTTDAWTEKYFDEREPHCADRKLFGR